jgi:predicted nucleic acid-binding protein
MPDPDYIFDTTVLSNFAEAGRLDLLEARYRDKAFVTIEVSDELRRGIHAGYNHLAPTLQQMETVHPEGWLSILSPETSEEHRLRLEFDHSLDPGEASCLALAISRGLVFATDDLAARRLAEQRSVRLTGTLGILIALVRSETLTLGEANAMLAAMIARNYRSPVDQLNDLI